MTRRLQAVFVGVLACAMMWHIAGCATMGPKDFNEAMVLVKQAQEAAERHGLAWSADVNLGPAEVYAKQSFGLHAIDVAIHLQANAAQAAGVPANAAGASEHDPPPE